MTTTELLRQARCLLTGQVGRMARDRYYGIACEDGPTIARLSALIWIQNSGCVESCGLVDFINRCKPYLTDCEPRHLPCSEIEIMAIDSIDCKELSPQRIQIVQ